MRISGNAVDALKGDKLVAIFPKNSPARPRCFRSASLLSASATS